MSSVQDTQVWAARGIVGLKHLVMGHQLHTFPELKAKYNLPNWIFFRFLQVRHAFQHQFSSGVTLESDPVERLLSSKVLIGPLSALYFRLSASSLAKLTKAFTKWKQDIPSLKEETWEDCVVSSYVSNLISAGDRFVQLKFLHMAYYTTRRLAAIYPDRSPSCSRCGDLDASFLHMTWSCPRLRSF